MAKSIYHTGNKGLDKAIAVAFQRDPLRPNRMQRILGEDYPALESPNKNKYHVSDIEDRTYVDGTVFDSKKEMERWQYLLLLQRGGHIHNLERQIPFELQEGFISKQWGDIRPILYILDFGYTNISFHKEYPGRRCVEDVKGMKTKEYLIKRKMLLHRYGNLLFFEI